MIIFKVSVFLLLLLSSKAEKKIELQDIEEDNLKSEKDNDRDNTEPRSQDISTGLVPLEFLKNGLLRYFEPASTTRPRYVHQYAVTEQPEIAPEPVASKPQYGSASTQQAMVGYLSNVPMQIYLVPQYHNGAQDQIVNMQAEVIHPTSATPRVPDYRQPQKSYIQVPTYVTPTVKTYAQQYSPPVSLYSYSSQSSAVPQPTTAPVLTYQVPFVQYQTGIAANPSKEYYQNTQYTESNTLDELHGHQVESPSTNSEVIYEKAPVQYTRFYPSRTPLRNEYRYSSIAELPHPNPIILKSPPPHLSHLPKTLPVYRPKSVFSPSSSVSSSYSSRPSEAYNPLFKRRPTSLLDSYIPSHVQVEYMKKGFAKDPLEAYEALSSGRHLHSYIAPRQYERGFLPNQMYHTAAGGITYGHYKRSPKIDKRSQKQ